jgi:hypothetical protein
MLLVKAHFNGKSPASSEVTHEMKLNFIKDVFIAAKSFKKDENLSGFDSPILYMIISLPEFRDVFLTKELTTDLSLEDQKTLYKNIEMETNNLINLIYSANRLTINRYSKARDEFVAESNLITSESDRVLNFEDLKKQGNIVKVDLVDKFYEQLKVLNDFRKSCWPE